MVVGYQHFGKSTNIPTLKRTAMDTSHRTSSSDHVRKREFFWVGCYDWIFFIRNLPNTKSGTRNYAAEMVQLNDSMTWETVCEVILLRKATSNFYTLLWDFSGQACRDNLLADSIWPITVFVLIQWEEEVRLTFSNAQEAWRQWCWKTGGIVRGSENLHFRRP